MMMIMGPMRSGAEVLLEVLETERVRHIFGNPGTTELPLIDALTGDSRFHYVLALHESVAAGMADGYAQATGRPSFLNLHTAASANRRSGRLPPPWPARSRTPSGCGRRSCR
jgi:benzoylformate decarboxylase